jgi:CO dehydrogenase/acetyl-CoA synthase beta subunit
MPSQLKWELKTQLKNKLADRNKTDLFDKIADETVATSIEDLISYLERVNHPALTMKPLV